MSASALRPGPFVCPGCSGLGYVLRRRQGEAAVRETCLRCDGSGWAS